MAIITFGFSRADSARIGSRSESASEESNLRTPTQSRSASCRKSMAKDSVAPVSYRGRKNVAVNIRIRDLFGSGCVKGADHELNSLDYLCYER